MLCTACLTVDETAKVCKGATGTIKPHAKGNTPAPTPEEGSWKRGTVLRGSCSSVSQMMQQKRPHSGWSASSRSRLASDQLHSNARMLLRVNSCGRPPVGNVSCAGLVAVYERKPSLLARTSLFPKLADYGCRGERQVLCTGSRASAIVEQLKQTATHASGVEARRAGTIYKFTSGWLSSAGGALCTCRAAV